MSLSTKYLSFATFHRKGFAMIGWIKLFGFGIHVKDKRKHPPLFSERYGYRKWYYIGRFGFRFFTPKD